MNGSFYIGAVGLESQQRALDVVANNIANLNTPAFKRGEASFAELMGAGAGGEATMNGVTFDPSQRIYDQGQLKSTGRPMDLAIDGEGFIELIGADGASRLWRGGSLTISAERVLTGAGGLPLKGMITVPDDAGPISIDRTGVVAATAADGSVQELGRIDLVRPRDLSALTGAGDGLYRVESDADLTVEDPAESSSASLVQGSVEGSNVQLADQMVSLMMMQRAFAANAQVLQAGDQLMQIANNLRR
jgi:flagellar basal-body rod protein FlgG